MKDELLLSIIIPVYNVENYLAHSIQSVREQTYKNLEIILVDDGSTDKSGELCDLYSKEDKRIYVVHQKNGGLSSARNTGLEIANGEYILLLDSDDWIHKDTCKILMNLAIENDADIVQGDFEKVYDDNIKDEEYISNSYKILSNIEALKYSYVQKSNVSSNVAWGKVYRKKLIDGKRYPVGKLHEDEFTTYKLIYRANKMIFTNEKLYYYRQRKESIMSTMYSKRRLDVLDAFEERISFIRENIDDKELLYLTLSIFSDISIRAYHLYKQCNINDYETLKGIKDKIKKIYRQCIFSKNVKIKRKIRITLFLLSPSLEKKLENNK